jgi:hypothetical protein
MHNKEKIRNIEKPSEQKPKKGPEKKSAWHRLLHRW